MWNTMNGCELETFEIGVEIAALLPEAAVEETPVEADEESV